jgi:DHA1 family multidrug resistance protein-like MFS transporter
MALTAPFWGYMCDRVGTKKIMLIALFGSIVAYAGMATSTSVIVIIMFRGLQGVFGGTSTVMFSLVALIVPAEELKKALSYHMAVMTLGSLIGPGVGGLLASAAGYRLTLASSSFLFLCIVPLVLVLSMPPPATRESEAIRFGAVDLKAILPDVIAIVLTYSCISFINPVTPWFLKSLGIPHKQLLLFTAIATSITSLAFVIASPLLTRVITDRTLPILSVIAAGGILATAFVADPYWFLALRFAVCAIQAGVTPSLLGGRSGRKGTSMGFLNSARFMGLALGPFFATYILGDGVPPRSLYMFTAMAGISAIASIFIYLTHKRSPPNPDNN